MIAWRHRYASSQFLVVVVRRSVSIHYAPSMSGFGITSASTMSGALPQRTNVEEMKTRDGIKVPCAYSTT